MPRETLTRDQIVLAAIELLDAEGTEGLSMRKLGQRMGSAPTAMYWHVGNKENLVMLAADRAWGEITFLDPAGHGWRPAARALAHDTYAMARRHPWLLPAIGTHFLYGQGMARFQNHSYAVFEAAGFAGWDLDWAVNTVFTFVAGTTLVDATRAALDGAKIRPGRGDADTPVQDVATWAGEIASQFPRLRARLAQQAGADPAEMIRQKFDFGLEAILDGLEARLAADGNRPPARP